MDRSSLATRLQSIRREVGGRYRKWSIDKVIPPLPADAVVPIESTPDVLLLCSNFIRQFDPQAHIKEVAFAQELTARNRTFAISADPGSLFDKSVAWFLPGPFVSPHLWDYSRQVREFAVGLERQGNRLFCSSAETEYWENKAHMHRAFEAAGIPTPKTTILSAENWESVAFDAEPVLIKQEHSAGSVGIHHFNTAVEAMRFVASYRFRPNESLLMQEVVGGATKDLRLTMVGNAMIEPATYWRTKSAEALATSTWTTTATTYNSTVTHDNIPDSVVPMAAEYLSRLGLRTAGIDLMWIDDDLSRDPVILEVSPYYQPNPPKPKRYEGWTYKQYKQRPYAPEGYFVRQHQVMRVISAEVLGQGFF